MPGFRSRAEVSIRWQTLPAEKKILPAPMTERCDSSLLDELCQIRSWSLTYRDLLESKRVSYPEHGSLDKEASLAHPLYKTKRCQVHVSVLESVPSFNESTSFIFPVVFDQNRFTWLIGQSPFNTSTHTHTHTHTRTNGIKFLSGRLIAQNT